MRNSRMEFLSCWRSSLAWVLMTLVRQGNQATTGGYAAAGWPLGLSFDTAIFASQVDRPAAAPYVLQGHEGEVTGVAWCPSDFGQARNAAS